MLSEKAELIEWIGEQSMLIDQLTSTLEIWRTDSKLKKAQTRQLDSRIEQCEWHEQSLTRLSYDVENGYVDCKDVNITKDVEDFIEEQEFFIVHGGHLILYGTLSGTRICTMAYTVLNRTNPT